MFRLAQIALLMSVVTCAADPEPVDGKKLQGKWQAVEIEFRGKTAGKDDPTVSNMRFVFDGNSIVLPTPGGAGKGRKQTFWLDPAKSPKQIDITSLDGEEKGQTTAAIYKIEKDRLTICMPYATKDPSVRPKEFKAGAADGIMLITLDRVKDK